MKIVENAGATDRSEKKRLEEVVSLSEKLTYAERQVKELSTVLATSRYAFRGNLLPL